MRIWWTILLVLGVGLSGCGGGKEKGLHSPDGRPVAFAVGEVSCPQCRMPVHHLRDSAQYIAPDGRVTVFDDPGCMVLWLQDHGVDAAKANLWVYTRDTNRWVEARKARYSQTDPTPMGYGFGAYEKAGPGRIGFDEMRLRVLRGLTLRDPKIRKKLLGH